MWRRSLASSFMRITSGRRCEGRVEEGRWRTGYQAAALDGVIGVQLSFRPAVWAVGGGD